MTRRRFGIVIDSNKTINKGRRFRREDKYLEDIDDIDNQLSSRKSVPYRCTSKNIECHILYVVATTRHNVQ